MPRRNPTPPRAPCAPTGSLAPHPLDDPDACPCHHARVCRWCATPLTAKTNAAEDDWYYVDSAGNSYGAPPQLNEKMGNKDKTLPPGVTDVYDLLAYYVRIGDINSYSMLTIDLDSGRLNAHRHDPASTPACESDQHPVPPWCCEMPMYLAARGWQCRVAKTWFRFA